jgi:AcrR family transcriptional regulator
MIQTKDELLRAKILAGADKLFQKYGLSKTTMEDIAREAGKGKSTLYYYFKSKEEIFDAIIRNEKEVFFEMMQNALARETSAVKKFEAFQTIRFEKIRKVVNLYSVLINETREGLMDNGQICTWRKKYDDKETNILKSILRFGTATGEFRAIDDAELDKLAFIFTSAQRGIEMDLIMYDKMSESEGLLKLLLDLTLNGLKKQPVPVEHAY